MARTAKPAQAQAVEKANLVEKPEAGGKTQARKNSLARTELETEVLYGLLGHPGHFVRRLHQISVAIFLKQTEKYDLTQVQFATLETINFAPGIDQSTLGHLIALDRQTISNVIGRLVDKGLVHREPRDGRTNALFATVKAKTILRSMRPLAGSVGGILLAPLTERERKSFVRMLIKLVESNNQLSRAPYNPTGKDA
ncbi:MarR family transcriptional regulator [Roseiarcaceae bacterium H3SJ34-1]|uniref:MarR family winged helix-turn-helix transcriptional regulator n=1 Tax=Terripilifer ovatus TaxID=3032367 RepID=UPI003AB97811|nr:MarR family transcriptional regulator [Roseiarcaceae bacterium H3SJ34-1]